MSYSAPVTELIHRRYSCRTYVPRVIASAEQASLSDFLASNRIGLLDTRGRFELVAATKNDRASLKGLGTYGFIKDPPGFIVGAIERGPRELEGYGYLLERAILRATDIGLGTCWLGGTFSKSSFAQTIALARNEIMPAVASIGYAADGSRDHSRIRRWARADFRLPPEALFFEEGFGRPLSRDTAGPFAEVLEAVRWAPSASNRQPWRIVRTEAGWQFYLQRAKGHGGRSLLSTLLRLADLPRVDLGIAMCHFELVAHALGLEGTWVIDEPSATTPGAGAEYIASWRPAR
jgi:nitroreductase